jgi:iron complex outermembrane receptor protein
MNKSLLILFSFLLSASLAFAQSPITGIIKRANGEPVPRATIKVRGTNISVSADDNGAFSISVKQETPFYLQVSSVGYKPQDFQITKFQDTPIELVLVESALLDEIVVTSRRRSEVLQDVPIPITVIGGQAAENAGAFNVNRLKELVPSVQLYASNARNTTLNIRGLGSTFGLTNDGIDPGVGFT